MCSLQSPALTESLEKMMFNKCIQIKSFSECLSMSLRLPRLWQLSYAQKQQNTHTRTHTRTHTCTRTHIHKYKNMTNRSLHAQDRMPMPLELVSLCGRFMAYGYCISRLSTTLTSLLGLGDKIQQK